MTRFLRDDFNLFGIEKARRRHEGSPLEELSLPLYIYIGKMCGRFSTPDEELVIKSFAINSVRDHFEVSFNAAPSQRLPVVYQRDGNRELACFRWGLIPSWAKDEKIGYKLINARVESAGEKPSFRKAFLKSRCLIPVRGFYEWKVVDERRQPFFIYPKSQELLGLAGLFEVWKSPEGEIVESFSILTTDANDFMESLHHRMPVIMDPVHYETWLDERLQNRQELDSLLKMQKCDDLTAHPVSLFVNNPRNNSEKCIEAVSANVTKGIQ